MGAFRGGVVWTLVAALGLAGCAPPSMHRTSGEPLPHPKLAEEVRTIVGPSEPLGKLAVVSGTDEPRWTALWPEWPNWLPDSAEAGAMAGAWQAYGLATLVPLLVVPPPILLGLVAAGAIGGALSAGTRAPAFAEAEAIDRLRLEAVLAQARPQAYLRARFSEEVARESGTRPLDAPIGGAIAADPSVGDLSTLARSLGADSVADVAILQFGLARGEVPSEMGVFANVRLRVTRVSDGAIILQKVYLYGPNQPLGELAPLTAYSLEMLAADGALVFRQELQTALNGIARIIARDPDLAIRLVRGTE